MSARAVRTAWALLLALAACGASAAELDALERAGQHIFMHGQSPSGAQVSARVGMGGLALSGASMACGNCHGDDGRGRAEGGVVPPDIRWSVLSKPYGHHHDGGRRHGPFDDDDLRRAVMDGIDPDGNPLDGAMPRYAMSVKDFAALAAYLKRLEWQLDAGLTAQAIRIGTLVPQGGRLAGLGASLQSLLRAYFEAVNQRGGIHGRRLELVVEPLPDDPAQARARAGAWMAEAGVFAVLAPVSVGIEAAVSGAASAARLPVIGPITLQPEDTGASNPQVFHVLPGVNGLAEVLLRHAGGLAPLARQPIALWHADSADGRAAAQALEASLQRGGWPEPVSMPMHAPGAPLDALAADMMARGVAAVLVLGGGADFAGLAGAAARIGWTPHLLVPGPLAGRDIVDLPVVFRDRVTLAYPTSPATLQGEALREYTALLPETGAARVHRPALVSAYAAGLLLVEGLKRTGRDLSRRRLLATLESVQGFQTGVVPPLSFNADRRIGSMGAYLVAVDLDAKTLRPIGGYRVP